MNCSPLKYVIDAYGKKLIPISYNQKKEEARIWQIYTPSHWSGGIGLGPESVLILKSHVRFSLMSIWMA
jgi:hypothetical protein